MVDIEQDVINSGIDANLRNEISQVKQSKPFPKKYIIIIAVVLVLIIASVSSYLLLVPKTQEVTFTFYLNGSKVTEDLNVGISSGNGVYFVYQTNKEELTKSLPLGEISLKVYSPGYNEFTHNYTIDKDTTSIDVKIKTEITPPKPTKEPTKVTFTVYGKDQFNPYTSPVTLDLTCVNSGTTASIDVTGSKDYTKLADCGPLSISAHPAGFNPYSGTCASTSCNIKLKKATETPKDPTTNDLIIKVVNGADDSSLGDVNVTVSKFGYSKTEKTDATGIVEFDGLRLDTYTITAKLLHDGKIFNSLNSVDVNLDNSPITKTITFNFTGDQFSLIIDANTDLKCKFDVSIFDENSKKGSSKGNDANTKIIFGSSDWKAGNYYLNVVPQGRCKKIYAPIYNMRISYPKDNDMRVQMKKINPKSFVFLTVEPMFGTAHVKHVAVNIIEADNNRFIWHMISDDSGFAGPFVLPVDTNYFIRAEDSGLKGETYYKYSYKKDTKPNDGNFYDANLILPMKIQSVDVNFRVNLDSRDINDFKVNAKWIIDETPSYFDFDSNKDTGVAQVTVPSGTPVLFKVSFAYNPLQGLDLDDTTLKNTTLNYNYYLNSMVFNKDFNKTIKINLNTSVLTSGKPVYKGIFLNQTLTKQLSGNSGMKTGDTYFVALDTMGVPATSSCLGNHDDKEGIVFSAEPDEKYFDVNDILLYGFNSLKRSTFGYKFKKSEAVPKPGVYTKNIFRVVTKIKPYKATNSVQLGYNVGNTAKDADNSLNLGEINGDPKKGSEKNIIDLNIQEKSTISLSINKGWMNSLELIYPKSRYKIQSTDWKPLGDSSLTCDEFAKKGFVDKLKNDFNLDNAFDDVYLSILRDNSGKADANIDLNLDDLSSIINLPVHFDLSLTLDLNIINNNGKTIDTRKIPLSVTINVNKGDKPQLSCFTADVNEKILKFVYSSDTNTVYHKDHYMYTSVYNGITPGQYIKLGKYFDVVFPDAKHSNSKKYYVTVKNKCDFDVNVSFQGAKKPVTISNTTKDAKSSFSPNEKDRNFSIVLTYNVKSGKNKGKKESVEYMIYAPEPVVLPPNIKTPNPKSSNVPLIETSKGKPNCQLRMCSREFFAKYVAKQTVKTNLCNISLMDDNFMGIKGVKGAVLWGQNQQTPYEGPGTYTKMWYGVDYNLYPFKNKINKKSDQIFYYLPPKMNDFLGPGNNKNIGMCTTEKHLTVDSSSTDFLFSCPDDGSVQSYKKVNFTQEKFDINNFYKFMDANVYNLNDYSKSKENSAKNRYVSGKHNDVNLTVYPGVQLGICEHLNSECYGEGADVETVLNNTSQDARYYIFSNGNLYNVSDLFYILDKNIQPKSTFDYNIVKFSGPTTDDAVPLSEGRFSAYNKSKFVLNKAIDMYNNRFLLYKQSASGKKVKEFNYYLNILNIVKYMLDQDQYPIIIGNSSGTHKTSKCKNDSPSSENRGSATKNSKESDSGTGQSQQGNGSNSGTGDIVGNIIQGLACSFINSNDHPALSDFYNKCVNNDDAKKNLCWGLLLSGQNDKFNKLSCSSVINEPDCTIPPKNDPSYFICNLALKKRPHHDYYTALKALCIYANSYKKVVYNNLNCNYLRKELCEPINKTGRYIKTNFYNNCISANTEADAKTTLCWGLLLSGQDAKFKDSDCLSVIHEPNCDPMPDSDEKTSCNEEKKDSHYFFALKHMCDYYHNHYRLYEKKSSDLHCDYFNLIT